MFILNAPTAQKSSVTLRLYKQGQRGKAYKALKMKKLGDERWEATVKGDLKGKFYTFDIGKGETPGTFAKAVGVNGNRGAIVDLYDTDPSGWDKDVRPALKSPADLVVYELHVRDFSISPTSGLKYKGKFLALTESKAIEYLKNLGINAIHFQPVFDFASIDETRLDKPQFNWGYDPKNYNVPEGSYATDPYSPATRIKEFKEMVMALHKAGIRVISMPYITILSISTAAISSVPILIIIIARPRMVSILTVQVVATRLLQRSLSCASLCWRA